MAGAKRSLCAIPGCDCKAMSDERGVDILPCECDFKICRDCYIDAVKEGDGMCPGCEEPYENTELDEVVVDDRNARPFQLPPSSGASEMERRMYLTKWLMTSQTDHNRWLYETYETKGIYGYGNAISPKGRNFGSETGNDEVVEPMDRMKRPGRLLTRKLKIPAVILKPYRLIIFIDWLSWYWRGE